MEKCGPRVDVDQADSAPPPAVVVGVLPAVGFFVLRRTVPKSGDRGSCFRSNRPIDDMGKCGPRLYNDPADSALPPAAVVAAPAALDFFVPTEGSDDSPRRAIGLPGDCSSGHSTIENDSFVALVCDRRRRRRSYAGRVERNSIDATEKPVAMTSVFEVNGLSGDGHSGHSIVKPLQATDLNGAGLML